MEDIIISIVLKIAEYTVDPILHHAKYLCCFNNFVGNLPSAKEELEVMQKSVKDRVNEAINRTEKVEPIVEKWLKDVEKVLKEVQLLEGRISNVSKSCMKRQCQYFLAKEIARKMDEMAKLSQNSKFDPFSKISELPGMEYYSSKGFVLFESTKSSYNKLLEAFKDESVCMIGLVGIGGSGKTTLAKEVGKEAENLKLFERVVIATVSKTLNIISIQMQIADQLSLKLGEESDMGKARRLSEGLRKGKTLVILDDVWEKLDFEAIGIPCNESSKGCCVLLTTRKREVCTSMQCQSIIELNLLTKEEAQTLFKFYANITDESPFVLKGLANEIVDECKGLPIAIVTVGSTLKGKSLEGWKSALTRLQDSKPLVMPKGLRSPHACLQLSYDNLTDELAKSFFLLCAIFPEDHEIHLEDLFRFGRGLGLTGTCQTLEKARGEMHVAIDILMDSCLLLHAENKRVKMHDMVRDVALWIASEKGEAILASAAMDPKMLVEDETIKDKKAISLWDLRNGQLPSDNQLYCPTLEILLLHSPEFGFEVPNVFLERFKMLKVMAFLTHDYTWIFYSGCYPLSLSQSTASLEKLHTLCLRGYVLGDISILERLHALEILDLRHSSFEEFPNGIAALKKLKLLDLYNCSIEKSNNIYEVIVKCLELEELYLYLRPSKEKFPHDFSFSKLRRYVIIQEHSHRIYLRDDILEKHRPSRVLCIDGFNAPAQSFISLPIKGLFLGAEYLHLENLEGGYKNVMPFMDQQSMNQLIVLILENCPEMECLFDSTIAINTNVDTEAPLSNLVSLDLHQMNNLQDVLRDPSSRFSLKRLEYLGIYDCIQLYRISFLMNSNLCNLKELRIYYCPMLTCLFMPSVVQTLNLLEELYIVGCSELKHIVEEVKEGNVDYVTRQSHTSLMLPKLKALTIGSCKRLEYILPMCCARRLVSLEWLSISDCCELKYVFGTEKEHQLSMYQQQSHHQTNIDMNFVNFHHLWLTSLPELVYIWPEYWHPSLPNWKELYCHGCPKVLNSLLRQTMIDSDLQPDTTTMVKKILWLVVTTFNQLYNQMFSSKPKVVLEFRIIGLSDTGVKGVYQFQLGEHESHRELVPLNLDLDYVDLKNLPELNFIWKGPTNFLCLQKLRIICVEGCPKLKTIFSSAILKSLPKLSIVQISNCEDLEEIFDSGDAQEFKSQYTFSQQVCFPELESIEVRECNKLKFLFYNFVAGHFPSLRTLVIEECSQLEKVFAFEAEVGDDSQEWTSKDGEQLLLDQLQVISLKSLPNFKEIHHKFKLKDHVKQRVNDCPKYSSSLYLYQGKILINSYAMDYNVK